MQIASDKTNDCEELMLKLADKRSALRQAAAGLDQIPCVL